LFGWSKYFVRQLRRRPRTNLARPDTASVFLPGIKDRHQELPIGEPGRLTIPTILSVSHQEVPIARSRELLLICPVMKLADCPVSRTLRFFDGKWKPLILNELKGGPLRTGELARRIPEVTGKVLTQQLRELERDGIVSRRILPRVPPHVEYKLSAFGLTLKPVLNTLCKWGEALAAGENKAAPEALNLVRPTPR